MRKRAIAASIVSSAAIVVVGWQIGNQTQSAETAASTVGSIPTQSNAAQSNAAPSPATSASASATPSSPGASSTPAPASPSAAPPTAAPPAATNSSTFTGSVVKTPYGNVQVQITVSNSTITDVTALHLTTDGGRSVQISNEAAPILRKEVLAAQSANVDSVSGATYTSDGYLRSLQAALDQAGL